MKMRALVVLAALLSIGCKKDEKPAQAPTPSSSSSETFPLLDVGRGVHIDPEDSREIVAALSHPETTTVLDVYPFERDPDGRVHQTSLHPAIWKLKNLRRLSIHCYDSLEAVPEGLGDLTRLEEFVIDNGNGCMMNVRLPESIGKLRNLRVLRLYGAIAIWRIGDEKNDPHWQPKPMPQGLGDLSRLEFLDLAHNGIEEVPTQIARLSNLTTLDVSMNRLDSVPDFVGRLPRLRTLIVDANDHIRLPQSLDALDSLHISIGDNDISPAEQDTLRQRFPKATFDFEGEWDGE